MNGTTRRDVSAARSAVRANIGLPVAIALVLAVIAGATRAPRAEPQAKGTPAGAATTKRFYDKTFGIQFELPSTWTYRVTPSKDYLFEGAKGTDAFELSLILQFVTKSANPGSSASDQLRRIADQLSRVPQAAVKIGDAVRIGGRQAPYFLATYTAKDSRGAATAFTHVQVAVDRGPYYYLVSFSGPDSIYRRFKGVWDGVIRTFAFVE